jgi:hypothetical protein
MDQDNQFEGSPRWSDFNAAAREKLNSEPEAFVLKADIAGYFMRIEPQELERMLLERGVDGNLGRDLRELLQSWQMLDIRGLPQGVPPSSPLGNFYLAPIDSALEASGLDFVRYMDDLWIFTDDHAGARRAQDVLERALYALGLTLSGEKSVPMHRRTALQQAVSATERLEQYQELFKEGWIAMLDDSYSDEDELPPDKEINAAAVLDLYNDLVERLRAGEYPDGFRPLLRNIYRELRAGGRPEIIGDVPYLVTRFPDLTGEAALYTGYTASHDVGSAVEAFRQLLEPENFHREQELVEIFHAALAVPDRGLEPLALRSSPSTTVIRSYAPGRFSPGALTAPKTTFRQPTTSGQRVRELGGSIRLWRSKTRPLRTAISDTSSGAQKAVCCSSWANRSRPTA